MIKKNYAQYPVELNKLKDDLNEANNMGINFFFDDRAFQTLNFDMNFPTQNLKEAETNIFKMYLGNKFPQIKPDEMEQLFNENVDIIEFLKNKNNIDIIVNIRSLKTLTIKNGNELTNEETYFSENANIVAVILFKIFSLLKREIISNYVYLNSNSIITKQDINTISSLKDDNSGKYEIIFNKYLYLLQNIANSLSVNSWMLVNILNICLLSADSVTKFFNQYIGVLNQNLVLLNNQINLSFTNREYTNLNNYLTYIKLMFNILDGNNNLNIIDLVKETNFIFIEVGNGNIIVTKYTKLCLSASFLENLPLALVINKETYNFNRNTMDDNSQFRWTIDQNSLNQINMPQNKMLVKQAPYINNLLLMVSNRQALIIFEKYNITKPEWLLREEEEEEEEKEEEKSNEYLEKHGGKRILKIKHNTLKYKLQQKHKTKHIKPKI